MSAISLISMLPESQLSSFDKELLDQVCMRQYEGTSSSDVYLKSEFTDVDTRSIWWLLRQHVPEKFQTWLHQQAVEAYQNRLGDTPLDMANILELFLRLDYVYASRYHQWYVFNRDTHRLEASQPPAIAITTVLKDFLTSQDAPLILIKNLYCQPFRRVLMQALENHLSSYFIADDNVHDLMQPESRTRLNSSLLGMTNGIIYADQDQLPILRPGYLQDHITQTTGIAWPVEPSCIDIGYCNQWLNLIFPDIRNKYRFLSALKETIMPRNLHRHQAYIWAGPFGTGKTTMAKLVRTMLGAYCIEKDLRHLVLSDPRQPNGIPDHVRLVLCRTQEKITDMMLRVGQIHYITNTVMNDDILSCDIKQLREGDLGKWSQLRHQIPEVRAGRIIAFEHVFKPGNYTEPDYKNMAPVLLWIVLNHDHQLTKSQKFEVNHTCYDGFPKKPCHCHHTL